MHFEKCFFKQGIFFCIILFDFQCYVFIVVWKLVQIYSTGENAFWKTVIDCKQLDCKKRSTWSSKSIIIKHPANIVIQLCLISTVVTDCKPLPWISFLDLGIPTFISSMVLYNINHDNLTAKDNWSSRQYRHSGTRPSRDDLFPRVILVGKNSFEYLTELFFPPDWNEHGIRKKASSLINFILNNFIPKRTYNMTYKTLIITAKTFYPIINTTTKLNHNAINEKIKLPGEWG